MTIKIDTMLNGNKIGYHANEPDYDQVIVYPNGDYVLKQNGFHSFSRSHKKILDVMQPTGKISQQNNSTVDSVT